MQKRMIQKDDGEQHVVDQIMETHYLKGEAGFYLEPGLPLYRVDSAFLFLFKYDSEAAFGVKTGFQLTRLALPGKREGIEHAIREQLSQNGAFRLNYQVICSDDAIIWIKHCGQCVSDHNNRQRVATVCVALPEASEIYSRQLKDEQKLLESRYIHEVKNRENLSPDIVANCRVNLTQNCVEEVRQGSKTLSLSGKLLSTDFKTRFSAFLSESFITPEQNRALCPKALLVQFNNGQNTIRSEFSARNTDGVFIHLKVTVALLKQPTSGDIIAFYYSTNITEAYIKQRIMDRLIRIDYDFACCVDMRQNTSAFYSCSLNTSLPPMVDAQANYTTSVIAFCNQYIVKEDRERIKAALTLPAIEATIKKHPFYTLKCGVHEPDGTIHTKLLRLAALEKDLVMLSRSDITETLEKEKVQNQLLQNALAKAESAGNAKQMFLANMSHDMRTPINAILGLATLARDETDDPVMIHELSRIEGAGRLLLTQINDVLDMTQIERTGIVFKPEPYTTTDFKNQIGLLVFPLCQQKHIHFTFNSDIPSDSTVQIDKTRLNQIFFNLLSNAVKYTPEDGEVSFSVKMINNTRDSITERFIVSDTGIGINPDYLPQLYLPFVRDKNDTTEKTEGTGLGLYIVKTLVDALGGTITVESRPHHGTTFTVELTFQKCSEFPEPSFQKAVDLKKLAHRRIIICEDHPLNAEITGRLLKKIGVIPEYARNGQIAVDLFKSRPAHTFDLILMDIRMPVMDGIAATHIIRNLNRPDAKTIPILAMTANAFKEDTQKTRDAGMNAHLSKPIESDILYRTLAHFLN